MPKTRYDYEEQHKRDMERIRELESELESLKLENHLLINHYRPVKPGRKLKLTRQVIKRIKELRKDGKTQRQIAEQLSISIGLVNKGCNQ